MTSDAKSSKDTRSRILQATFDVLGRRGRSKLNLSEVAAAAEVSRPTLYRLFSSKEELLTAFGIYEQRNIQNALATATEGRTGADRLDACLRFIVDLQGSYSLGRMVDVEPEHVLFEVSRVLPTMRELIQPMIDNDDDGVIAASIVRLAICHYLVRSDDDATFLAQLRHVAGLTSDIAS